jgi:hypothetical protein
MFITKMSDVRAATARPDPGLKWSRWTTLCGDCSDARVDY